MAILYVACAQQPLKTGIAVFDSSRIRMEEVGEGLTHHSIEQPRRIGKPLKGPTGATGAHWYGRLSIAPIGCWERCGLCGDLNNQLGLANPCLVQEFEQCVAESLPFLLVLASILGFGPSFRFLKQL